MSGCNCQSHRNEDVECRLERLEHQMTSWLDQFRWPREALSDLQRDVIAIRVSLQDVKTTGEKTLKEFQNMAANFDELNADLQVLVTGYQSVVAENVILKEQLANADQATQDAVAAAVAADDAVDQAAVDAADAVVEAALNPAPPVDVPPAE
jgi:chromosome segregation ATPase